ncbi:MAG: Biopolymer transport protein ExbD/TolR [uncultured Sphingomonadaceae bacterium]|uniref:Biopolymer transport protein ExbD/TolR n=1 Tax=uncultured Sphingomonadaceae bacterium TaxID=169976 RepID=A0A6J4U5H6_9SPHN|nr:MAG: Biopolymer transport protein ExbD/TolR [uncultured Sphingomonadaceae bacterium]
MAMSAPSSGADDDAPITDINTTPLVDVMLVLLIIFLITVPVVVQTVPVALPKVAYQPTITKPENVALSVRGDGAGGCEVYWNMAKVGAEELRNRATAKLEADIKRLGGPQNLTPENMPEVHIRGDVDTPYKCIGGAVYTMQSAGFARVGFISEPPAGSVMVRR